ncbi:MAG: ion transporter [Nitrospinae bacterium]|nr:ion transporter [Nitrospinota bacterium]
MKEKIYSILTDEKSDSLVKRGTNLFIIALIVLNALAVALETVKSFSKEYAVLLDLFETFSVMIFTAEYILRLWVCNLSTRFGSLLIGRIRYVFTPLAIVDLLAILPFYLANFFPFDLRFIRILRLFRLVRLIKLARYSVAIKVFSEVLTRKKEELVISTMLVLVLLALSSSLMYFVENESQPEIFSSIPDAMWWGVMTLTTVGYGDVYPITVLGKIIAACISVLGIGMFAIPAGILASGFGEVLKTKNAQKNCPHCGNRIEH